MDTSVLKKTVLAATGVLALSATILTNTGVSATSWTGNTVDSLKYCLQSNSHWNYWGALKYCVNYGDYTITETALASEVLSTLKDAVVAAGLADTLNGYGDFTVFAPTNAAFGRLPAGTLATLLAEPGLVTLTKVLKYHVVSGEVFSKNLHDGQIITTLAGDTIRVEKKRNGVINLVFPTGKARVVAADVNTSNGVIHVINKVLIP